MYTVHFSKFNSVSISYLTVLRTSADGYAPRIRPFTEIFVHDCNLLLEQIYTEKFRLYTLNIVVFANIPAGNSTPLCNVRNTAPCLNRAEGRLKEKIYLGGGRFTAIQREKKLRYKELKIKQI
jgi:hypothetical protein